MLTFTWLLAVFIGFLALAYADAAGWMWSAGIAAALLIALATHALPAVLVLLLAIVGPITRGRLAP